MRTRSIPIVVDVPANRILDRVTKDISDIILPLSKINMTALKLSWRYFIICSEHISLHLLPQTSLVRVLIKVTFKITLFNKNLSTDVFDFCWR